MRTYYIVIDSAAISLAAEHGRAPQVQLSDNPNGCYVIKAIEARDYAEARKRFENWLKTPGKTVKIPAFSGWTKLGI